MKTIIAVAGLVGCAQTPADLRETGARANFTSTSAPETVAECIRTNAENLNQQARIRTVDGKVEVLTFAILDGALNALMVAELTPAQPGSRGEVFITRNAIQAEKVKESLTKGC